MAFNRREAPQAMRGAVDLAKRFSLAHAKQSTVQTIRPPMVGTRERSAGVRATLRKIGCRQLGAAMAADVEERIHLAVLATNNEDRTTGEIVGKEITGFGKVGSHAENKGMLAKQHIAFLGGLAGTDIVPDRVGKLRYASRLLALFDIREHRASQPDLCCLFHDQSS
jgi:hypothetical protein